MRVNARINGKNRVLFSDDPLKDLRSALYSAGCSSVRDSDDREGFTGSDTVIFNGRLMYSNLIPLFRAEGAEIYTAESLLVGRKINDVQRAMIDSGIVQSAYNSPSAALILTYLLEKKPDAGKEDVKEALSGLFVRDAGYEHYYLAVKLCQEKRKYGEYKSKIAPSFRENLSYVGKATGKIDGEALVSGEKVFVEDKVLPGYSVLRILRSPYAHAYIKSIDTEEAEKLEGVSAVFTCFNVPDVYYMQAGQGNPEPSPHDRRLINRKVRHVGDRVAAVVADSDEIAEKALSLIKVEYEPLDAVFTVEEAMAEGAPLVHNGVVEYRSGAPDDLDEYNKSANELDGKVIYQFPLHGDIRHNIAAGAHGGIGDVEKGFREADAVVDSTYQTSQVQCTPLEPHVCYSRLENGRLVLHCSTQVPYHVRRIVSWVCQIPEHKIHVIKERVGGGYGSKQDILVEDLTGYATWITGKPIYYRNSREEEFWANSTRHPMRVRVKMGGRKDSISTRLSRVISTEALPVSGSRAKRTAFRQRRARRTRYLLTSATITEAPP